MGINSDAGRCESQVGTVVSGWRPSGTGRIGEKRERQDV
jgi:hypothetical protein